MRTDFVGYCASAACCENPTSSAAKIMRNSMAFPTVATPTARSVRFQPAHFFPALEPPRKYKWKDIEIVLDAQFPGSMNRPMGIVKKLSRKRDQICLAVTEYLLGMMRLGNQSDGNGLDARFATHAIRIGNVIARMARDDRRIDRSTDAA